MLFFSKWWAFRDLNPGPIGYEPTALPAELKAQKVAPQVGFEPTTYRLTAGCSTLELLRNTIIIIQIFALLSRSLFNQGNLLIFCSCWDASIFSKPLLQFALCVLL